MAELAEVPVTPRDAVLAQITSGDTHRLLVYRSNLDNVVGSYVEFAVTAAQAGNDFGTLIAAGRNREMGDPAAVPVD